MKEENKIRLMRYGLGIIFLIISFISLYLVLSSENPETAIATILMVFLISIGLFSFVASAVLIGRCETFIKNKEYLVEENKR